MMASGQKERHSTAALSLYKGEGGEGEWDPPPNPTKTPPILSSQSSQPHLISPHCCPSASRSHSFTVLSQEPEHSVVPAAAKHQTQPCNGGGGGHKRVHKTPPWGGRGATGTPDVPRGAIGGSDGE